MHGKVRLMNNSVTTITTAMVRLRMCAAMRNDLRNLWHLGQHAVFGDLELLPIERREGARDRDAAQSASSTPSPWPQSIPSSRIASGSCSTTAAGASPACTNSSRIAAADEEPTVAGTSSTRPAIDSPDCGCRLSEITPVFGSTPPQKLIGAVNARADALVAGPDNSTSALNSVTMRTRRLERRPRRSQRSRTAIHTAPNSRCLPGRSARTFRSSSSGSRPASRAGSASRPRRCRRR